MTNKTLNMHYSFENQIITIKQYLLSALKLNGHHKLELDGQWYWNLHYTFNIQFFTVDYKLDY